jgi:hypothetical protein
VSADFAYWSKAAHWTLDEAIALSFGRAPEVVTWKQVEPYLRVSPFAFEYQRRRELALRAVVWQQLFDPVLPGIFLAWAKRSDFSIPPELEAAVTARGIQVADWQSLYKELKEKFDTETAKWCTLCKRLNAQLDEQRQRDAALVQEYEESVEQLKSQIKELHEQHERTKIVQSPERPLSTRERNSLLSLVIGMAVSGYRYDPKASRSEQTSEIASDLAKVGVPLDADTVRKWLKEASDLLPPEEVD